MVDITWYGQSCFKVKGKKGSIVFDPYDADFTGLSQLKLEGDVVCVTHDHGDHNNVKAVSGDIEGKDPLVITGPGEYEISQMDIVGIASYHDSKQGAERGKNTIYSAKVDDINIVHLGDLGQAKLSEEQVEQLSSCDVLFIPVGGVYTISAKEAPDVISQIEPKIVIPMHYKIDRLKFDLAPVDKFLSAMGKAKKEPQNKLSLSKDKLPEEIEIVVLNKQ